jgi:hypothetical protein
MQENTHLDATRNEFGRQVYQARQGILLDRQLNIQPWERHLSSLSLSFLTGRIRMLAELFSKGSLQPDISLKLCDICQSLQVNRGMKRDAILKFHLLSSRLLFCSMTSSSHHVTLDFWFFLKQRKKCE